MGKKLLIGTALLVVAGVGVWGLADAGDENVPGGAPGLVDPDALVTIEWRGAGSQKAAWARTAISRLEEDPDVMEFCNHIGELITNAIEDAAPDDMPGGPKHLRTLFISAWERPIGLSLIDMGKDGIAMLGLADLGPRGEDTARAVGALSRIVKHLKVDKGAKVGGYPVTEFAKNGKVRLVHGFVGKMFVVASSRRAFERGIRLAKGKVARRPSPKRAVVAKMVHADTAALWAYVDLPAVLKATDARKDADTRRILAALGVDAIEAGGVGLSLYERGFRTTCYLHLPSGRAGLLNLMADQPLDLTKLRAAPKGCKGFMAVNLDAPKLMANLRGMVGAADKKDVKDFDKALADFSENVGFDLEKDLLPALGTFAMLVQPGQANLMFFTVPSLVWEVRDRAKVAECMHKAADKYAPPPKTDKPGDKKPAKSGPFLAHRTYAGADIWVLRGAGPMPFSPAVGLTDTHLILSAFAQDPKGLARRMKRAPADWQGPPAFHAQVKHLRRPLMLANYTDVKDGIKTVMGVVPMVGALLQNEIGFRPELVPPADVLAEPMFPAVGGVSRTDKGVVLQTYGPLPINLGFADVGSVGLLAALLLPAVTQAREAARRTQTRSNMHQVGLAGHNYHDTHNHFPGATIPNDALPDKRRLSWLADILPFVDETDLYNKLDKKKAWDEEPNLSVAKEKVVQYQCMSEFRLTSPKGFGLSHFAGCLGVVDANGKVIKGKEGIFAPGKPCRIRDVRDGTSNTIWIGQIKTGLGPWIAGGKGTARGVVKGKGLNTEGGFGSQHEGGAFVLFTDGAVRFLSENVDQTVLEALSSRAGNEVIDDEDY